MSLRRSPEHDECRWLLKALRETAHELESQVWGLDEEALRWRPTDDGWSLKEHCAHLRDCEEHLLDSLQRIAYGDGADVPAFDADALVLDRDYRQVDLYAALERFDELRGRTMTLLWSLAPDDWERGGRHRYRGPVTIAQLVREQNEHDLEHLWQARRLRESLTARAGTR